MRLALGTAQFGMNYGIANQIGQVNDVNVKALLKLAYENQINVLDTAIAYGESESCLGRVKVDNFMIVSKLPALPIDCKNIYTWVFQEVQASLDRLKVGHLYGLLLHHAMDLLSTHGAELYKALKLAQEKGLIQKVGVSIYSPNHLEELVRRYQLDLVQAPLNIFDQRIIYSGWLHRLKAQGVEVHTRSVFLQGLLLMNKQSIPLYFSAWQKLFAKWYEFLEGENISPLQACLALPAAYEEIDHVLVGVEDKTQLTDIFNAVGKVSTMDLSAFASNDENLINPYLWNYV